LLRKCDRSTHDWTTRVGPRWIRRKYDCDRFVKIFVKRLSTYRLATRGFRSARRLNIALGHFESTTDHFAFTEMTRFRGYSNPNAKAHRLLHTHRSTVERLHAS
jgi:hypothetical protein